MQKKNRTKSWRLIGQECFSHRGHCTVDRLWCDGSRVPWAAVFVVGVVSRRNWRRQLALNVVGLGHQRAKVSCRAEPRANQYTLSVEEFCCDWCDCLTMSTNDWRLHLQQIAASLRLDHFFNLALIWWRAVAQRQSDVNTHLATGRKSSALPLRGSGQSSRIRYRPQNCSENTQVSQKSSLHQRTFG